MRHKFPAILLQNLTWTCFLSDIFEAVRLIYRYDVFPDRTTDLPAIGTFLTYLAALLYSRELSFLKLRTRVEEFSEMYQILCPPFNGGIEYLGKIAKHRMGREIFGMFFKLKSILLVIYNRIYMLLLKYLN